jgi:predicted small metal-binding protein
LLYNGANQYVRRGKRVIIILQEGIGREVNGMKSLILRCRDAGMIGPFCDYVTDEKSFEDAIKELRIHTKTHHERDITDKEVLELRKKVTEKYESPSIH